MMADATHELEAAAVSYAARRLELLARLRLWRVAVARRLGAELPDLRDPFGARIRHAPTAVGVRVWSVGRDGADDGGDPLSDLVLELE